MTAKIFAESELGNRSTMREWDSYDQRWDAMGAAGDELEYEADTDSFSYALGSGVAPRKTVPNPVPGDPRAGARLVADMADADWGLPV